MDQTEEDIPEVASREIGLSDTGTKISFATSHHNEYAPYNILDKKSTKPWLTSGMYPQTLIMSFPSLMDVKEVQIKCYNAKCVSIEKSETGLLLNDFESVTSLKNLEHTKGICQNNYLAQYTFAAAHIKLIIHAGYDSFCAVFRLSVTGGFSSKSAGLFGMPSGPQPPGGMFSFGQQQQLQQMQTVGQMGGQAFSFGNSGLFKQPEQQNKPSLFFGATKKVDKEANNSADDENEEDDENTIPGGSGPSTQHPFVTSKPQFKVAETPKLVSQGDNDPRTATETPTREPESDSENEREGEGQMWNALGGMDSPIVGGIPAKFSTSNSPRNSENDSRPPADYFLPQQLDGQGQNNDDEQEKIAKKNFDTNEGSGFLSDDVNSSGDMRLGSPRQGEELASGGGNRKESIGSGKIGINREPSIISGKDEAYPDLSADEDYANEDEQPLPF